MPEEEKDSTEDHISSALTELSPWMWIGFFLIATGFYIAYKYGKLSATETIIFIAVLIGIIYFIIKGTSPAIRLNLYTLQEQQDYVLSFARARQRNPYGTFPMGRIRIDDDRSKLLRKADGSYTNDYIPIVIDTPNGFQKRLFYKLDPHRGGRRIIGHSDDFSEFPVGFKDIKVVVPMQQQLQQAQLKRLQKRKLF